MSVHSAEVYASDHSFGLFDRGEILIETADWSTGLLVTMLSGAMVYTGVDRGPVRLTVDLRDSAPDGIGEGPWDDIVEADVHAPHGELLVQPLAIDTHAAPPLPLLSHHGAGTYRIRAHTRGRDLHFDAVWPEADEDYLLVVWPTQPRPALIIRATDRCGYGLRLASLATPRPPAVPTLEEAPHTAPGSLPVDQFPADRERQVQALLASTGRTIEQQE